MTDGDAEKPPTKIQRFEQLEVWQHAHELVLRVYRVISRMPSDQKFGLCSQMQRAAVSLPANIAEGFKRRGGADKVRFYNIAEASLEELRYYFTLCRDLGYALEYQSLAEDTDRIARMLAGLIKSVRG
jgi:four helix bundle protein